MHWISDCLKESNTRYLILSIISFIILQISIWGGFYLHEHIIDYMKEAVKIDFFIIGAISLVSFCTGLVKYFGD